MTASVKMMVEAAAPSDRRAAALPLRMVTGWVALAIRARRRRAAVVAEVGA